MLYMTTSEMKKSKKGLNCIKVKPLTQNKEYVLVMENPLEELKNATAQNIILFEANCYPSKYCGQEVLILQ